MDSKTQTRYNVEQLEAANKLLNSIAREQHEKGMKFNAYSIGGEAFMILNNTLDHILDIMHNSSNE